MVQKVARSSTDLKVRGSVPESFALLKPKLMDASADKV